MSKFGWSYPPGAAGDPFAPYNQTEDEDESQSTCRQPRDYREVEYKVCYECYATVVFPEGSPDLSEDMEQAIIEEMNKEAEKHAGYWLGMGEQVDEHSVWPCELCNCHLHGERYRVAILTDKPEEKSEDD